ncbi:MAG: MBL fold metallo-hydrolase, partial [Halobacteriales archaeon]|nr:MBL fold metallo-hydrolase [Halobacteriales archaeon]
GHASVRIETGDGTVIYIDPWSDVLDGAPGDADVVFVTHDDFDHYDPDGIEAVAGDGAVVVAYEGVDTSELDREVVGLVLSVGDATVYFPSDTDFLDEHADIRADVFIPPIGGHYTMDRHEAAEFARSVDPELVIPVHYNTFEAIETDVDAFAEELSESGIQVAVI